MAGQHELEARITRCTRVCLFHLSSAGITHFKSHSPLAIAAVNGGSGAKILDHCMHVNVLPQLIDLLIHIHCDAQPADLLGPGAFQIGGIRKMQ